MSVPSRDPESGARRRHDRCPVVEGKGDRRAQTHCPPLAAERPGISARRLDSRVSDAAVLIEIIGRRRHSAAREVVRRGEPHEPGCAEGNALPARRRNVADAQDDVETVQPKERTAVPQRQVEDDIGVRLLKFGKHRDHESVTDRGREIDADSACRPTAGLQRPFCGAVGFDSRPRVVEELAPVLRQVHPPRRSVEQAGTHAFLKAADMERHHCSRDAHTSRAAGERSSLDNGKEGFQSSQSIHDHCPMANIRVQSRRDYE
jgi:hypothetical protein